MKRIRHRNAILCEYVAQGHGNKHTIVNAFSGDIIVGMLPLTLQFGFYTEIILEPAQSTHFSLTFMLGTKRIARVGADFENADFSEPAVLAVPMFHLPFQGDSELSIICECEGFQKTTLLTKRVYKDTSRFPTA